MNRPNDPEPDPTRREEEPGEQPGEPSPESASGSPPQARPSPYDPPPGSPGPAPGSGPAQPYGRQPGYGAPPPYGYPAPPLTGGPGGAGGERVPNYLVPAIVATVLCCLPAGVVSIVYAAQVNGKLTAGDIVGARRASGSARIWLIVAVVLGLIINGLLVVSAIARTGSGSTY